MDPEAIPTPVPSPTDRDIESVWRDDRRYLVGMATQLLRDPAAAEDVVQEAFGRLMSVDLEEIHDVRGWLAVVVRRLSLNRIKSAYNRRESATGVEPPEPGGFSLPDGVGGDPADRVTLDGQVQLALAIVLDRLTPAERTAFVLHDVFGFPYEVIGEIVGRTATACRKSASRARRAIRSDAPSLQPDTTPPGTGADATGSVVAERFIAACAGGDMAELLAVLDPDVVGEATMVGRGQIGWAKGADNAVSTLLDLFGPGTGAVMAPIPIEGDPGIVVLRGRIRAVITFDEVVDGAVRHMRAVVLPPSASRNSSRHNRE